MDLFSALQVNPGHVCPYEPALAVGAPVFRVEVNVLRFFAQLALCTLCENRAHAPTSRVRLFVVCFYYCCKFHFVCEWGVKRDKPTSSKPSASESSGRTQAKVNKLVSSSWFVLWLACGTPVFFRLWNVCVLLVFLMDFLLVDSFLFLCKLACGWLVAGL